LTALPSAADLTGPITEGDFKAAITALRDFLAGLLGTDGLAATGLSTLGAFASVHLPKTGAYTVVLADRGRLIDATSGTWTLNLPAVASAGNGFSLMVRNSGTGTITIDPSGAELVDGATTVTVAPGNGLVLMCTGTAWAMQRVVSSTFSTADFTLVDSTDPTKKVVFNCGGFTSGTTRTVGFPNNDGNVVMNNQGTTNIGNLTTATTVNIGAGATTTGVAKTVNIGTAGLSGSITTVNIGSTVSGALGQINLNEPTKALALAVASLPSASSAGLGARHAVTDSTLAYTSANVGTTVTGGGSNWCPVWSDGTNWKIG